jgi:hypothetical protein
VLATYRQQCSALQCIILVLAANTGHICPQSQGDQRLKPLKQHHQEDQHHSLPQGHQGQ